MSDPEEDRNSDDSDSIEEEGLGKLQGPCRSQMLPKQIHIFQPISISLGLIICGLVKLCKPSRSQMLPKSDTHFSSHFHKPWSYQLWFG